MTLRQQAAGGGEATLEFPWFDPTYQPDQRTTILAQSAYEQSRISAPVSGGFLGWLQTHQNEVLIGLSGLVVLGLLMKRRR